MPVRIQRRRDINWRMPEGAKYVGRPSKHGNPFKVSLISAGRDLDARAQVQAVVDTYETELRAGRLPYDIDDVIDELAGQDLVCWCPLDMPCHADVLLKIANQEEE